MTGNLTYVEWEDHNIDAGWTHHDDNDLTKRVVCKTVGWVVGEDDHTLCLGATVRMDKPESAMRQYIVKSAIVKRHEVPK